MTLLRTDSQGYIVLSDLGKIYYLNKVTQFFADTNPKIMVIRYKGDRDIYESDKFFGFFYADESNLKPYLSKIKNEINNFESTYFTNSEPLLYSEVIETF